MLDLGCWPGGFMQVAAEKVGPRGLVVGVDLVLPEPFENDRMIPLQGDLYDPGVCDVLLSALGGEPADVVLCDAAPKLTGVRVRDRVAEERLLEAVEGVLPRLLRPGGDLLVKILEGPEAQLVERRIRLLFRESRTVKSKATRKGSSERYLLARGHRLPVD